jgi:hypothetical protein
MNENNIENKLTPEEHLSALLHYPGNVELYNRVRKYIREVGGKHYQKSNFKDGYTYDSVTNNAVLNFMEIIFGVCHMIHLFHNNQFKVLEFVKSFLKGYEISFAAFNLEMINFCLNDDNRFEINNSQIKFIKLELSQFNIEDIHNDASIFSYKNLGLNFFGIECEMKNYINSYVHVIGIVKSKDEIVKEFINGNRNEILNNLRGDHSLNFPNAKEVKKLQWNGNTNELVFLFKTLSTYNVNGKPLLDIRDKNISNFIHSSFLDKQGKEIGIEGLKTALKDNRPESKPKNGKINWKDLSEHILNTFNKNIK